MVTEIPPPGGTAKRRRVSVPVVLGPKRRRLVVRGIKMDDDYAVEGVRRWASVSVAAVAVVVHLIEHAIAVSGRSEPHVSHAGWNYLD